VLNRKGLHRGGIALAAAALLAVCAWQWRVLFAWPATFGTGGNMVAWAVCGVIAFGWQHRQNLRLHQAREDAAQARHEEAMAKADAHHEALKAHVAAVQAGAAPLSRTLRVPGGRS
jgi:type VI protein secretion system component VasK